MNDYQPNVNRYEKMTYRRCGKSGLKLPLLSLGLWHSFGRKAKSPLAKEILRTAFDNGITHFDLANNYGPPPGSAEANFGKILASDFKNLRDELIISTKAGYTMWPGPYGDWGSRKYLIASLDQSLQRMGLDYVDIFYHHRPDPNTPLEETMEALAQVVKQGKALYVGVSRYSSDQTIQAAKLLKKLNTPFVIHQPRYNMLDRHIEEDQLLNTLQKEGIGAIAFSPLEQGILTSKYIGGIPKDSRAADKEGHLTKDKITKEVLQKVQALQEIAQNRNQSLPEMAFAWLLKDERLTSVLMGVSKISQLQANLNALDKLQFSSEELTALEQVLD